MKYLLKTEAIDSQVNFLICSLYTLSPNAKLFQYANFGLNLGLDYDESPYSLINSKNCIEFQNLLKKKPLRDFSYNLVKSLLDEDSFFRKENLRKTTTCYKQSLVLKNYLRKFRHNYRYYFKVADSNDFINPQKLNSIAIKCFMLIHGI